MNSRNPLIHSHITWVSGKTRLANCLGFQAYFKFFHELSVHLKILHFRQIENGTYIRVKNGAENYWPPPPGTLHDMSYYFLRLGNGPDIREFFFIEVYFRKLTDKGLAQVGNQYTGAV